METFFGVLGLLVLLTSSVAAIYHSWNDEYAKATFHLVLVSIILNRS